MSNNPLEDLIADLKRAAEAEVYDEGEGPPLSPICKESIVKLADSHIRMFQLRIQSKARNVNIPECERYLAIWQSARERASYEDLTPEERGEITDARVDGGYNHLLLPEERL